MNTENDFEKIRASMDGLTNEDILRILESYKVKREYDKKRYDKVKDNADFKKQNSESTQKWIKNNKEKHKKSLENSAERRKIQSKLNYYRRLNKVDKFQEKFPILWDIVLEQHLPTAPM
tara:strand:- start:37 stop:393 length:357 start_codon:yes stop_codon:yes gene_type:complete